MISINPKLKYLQSKLADFEKKQQMIEKEIPTVLPNDVMTKDVLEEKLYSIFYDMEEVNQKIQKLEYLQKKLDGLNQKRQNVESRIEAVVPADILTKDALENQRNLLSEEIYQVHQSIGEV